MARREIVILGDGNSAVLRRRAVKVTTFDEKLGQLIDDMVETMLAAPGVGLAAPQVNVGQRVIVVRLPDDERSREEYGDQAGVLYELVNPQIVRAAKEVVDGTEACLSIPGYFGTVPRSVEVTVKGQDRHGRRIRIKARDWLARVFQHEIDHLNGVLFIDHATELWREEEAAAEREPVPAPELEGK